VGKDQHFFPPGGEENDPPPLLEETDPPLHLEETDPPPLLILSSPPPLAQLDKRNLPWTYLCMQELESRLHRWAPRSNRGSATRGASGPQDSRPAFLVWVGFVHYCLLPRSLLINDIKVRCLSTSGSNFWPGTTERNSLNTYSFLISNQTLL